MGKFRKKFFVNHRYLLKQTQLKFELKTQMNGDDGTVVAILFPNFLTYTTQKPCQSWVNGFLLQNFKCAYFFGRKNESYENKMKAPISLSLVSFIMWPLNWSVFFVVEKLSILDDLMKYVVTMTSWKTKKKKRCYLNYWTAPSFECEAVPRSRRFLYKKVGQSFSRNQIIKTSLSIQQN